MINRKPSNPIANRNWRNAWKCSKMLLWWVWSFALYNCCELLIRSLLLWFQLVQQAPEDFGELYSQVVTSPSKKYFLVVLMTFIGFIFIIGLFCGRATRRTIALKNKWSTHTHTHMHNKTVEWTKNWIGTLHPGYVKYNCEMIFTVEISTANFNFRLWCTLHFTNT